MKKILLPILLLAAAAAYALDFKTIESPGVHMTASWTTSVAGGTYTVSGYGVSYSVASTTGTVDFVVKHSSYAGGNPDVNASSTIYVLAGQSVNDQFKSITRNPLIVITRLDSPGTTVYIDITYLKARAPGAF